MKTPLILLAACLAAAATNSTQAQQSRDYERQRYSRQDSNYEQPRRISESSRYREPVSDEELLRYRAQIKQDQQRATQRRNAYEASRDLPDLKAQRAARYREYDRRLGYSDEAVDRELGRSVRAPDTIDNRYDIDDIRGTSDGGVSRDDIDDARANPYSRYRNTPGYNWNLGDDPYQVDALPYRERSDYYSDSIHGQGRTFGPGYTGRGLRSRASVGGEQKGFSTMLNR